MAFRTTLVIRFGDVDPAGIVYYPRYLHFCHVAMEDFFQQGLGVDYPRLIAEDGLGFPTVHLEVDYHQPLRYGDTVVITVEVEEPGGSSLAWHFTFFRQGDETTPVFRARTVSVGVDMKSFAKRRIPDWLRQLLSARGFVRAVPQGQSMGGIS